MWNYEQKFKTKLAKLICRVLDWYSYNKFMTNRVILSIELAGDARWYRSKKSSEVSPPHPQLNISFCIFLELYGNAFGHLFFRLTNFFTVWLCSNRPFRGNDIYWCVCLEWLRLYFIPKQSGKHPQQKKKKKKERCNLCLPDAKTIILDLKKEKTKARL